MLLTGQFREAYEATIAYYTRRSQFFRVVKLKKLLWDYTTRIKRNCLFKNFFNALMNSNAYYNLLMHYKTSMHSDINVVNFIWIWLYAIFTILFAHKIKRIFKTALSLLNLCSTSARINITFILNVSLIYKYH